MNRRSWIRRAAAFLFGASAAGGMSATVLAQQPLPVCFNDFVYLGYRQGGKPFIVPYAAKPNFVETWKMLGDKIQRSMDGCGKSAIWSIPRQDGSVELHVLPVAQLYPIAQSQCWMHFDACTGLRTLLPADQVVMLTSVHTRA